MIVADLTGDHEARTLEQLEALLAVRHGGGNEFWISAETKSFPLLAVNVQGHDAVVHFFPDEAHPGFQSVGDKGDKGTTSFPGGTGDKVDVPDEAVIPLKIAMAAATQFAESFDRPELIRWFEL